MINLLLDCLRSTELQTKSSNNYLYNIIQIWTTIENALSYRNKRTSPNDSSEKTTDRECSPRRSKSEISLFAISRRRFSLRAQRYHRYSSSRYNQFKIALHQVRVIYVFCTCHSWLKVLRTTTENHREYTYTQRCACIYPIRSIGTLSIVLNLLTFSTHT